MFHLSWPLSLCVGVPRYLQAPVETTQHTATTWFPAFTSISALAGTSLTSNTCCGPQANKGMYVNATTTQAALAQHSHP
jgi:hypothetical protein